MQTRFDDETVSEEVSKTRKSIKKIIADEWIRKTKKPVSKIQHHSRDKNDKEKKNDKDYKNIENKKKIIWN